MDYQLWVQAGIGIVTLVILREYLLRTDKRIDSRDQAFVHFVESHNEKMTNLVVEATFAIKESTKAIQAASELICKVSKKINGDK